MPGEFEIVPHAHLGFMNAFLVRLSARTPHIHRDLELGLVLEDSVVLHTNNQDHLLKKGDLFLVNSMEPHALFSGEKGALLLAAQLSPTLLDPVFPQAAGIRYPGGPNLRVLFAHEPGRYQELCRDYLGLMDAYLRGRTGDGLRCLALCHGILAALQEKTPWQVLDKADYLPFKQRVERIQGILDYIDGHFRQKLLLGEIAQRENLSLTYLSHAFQDTMGMTFQGYLSQKRFEYACHLLTGTDRNILDISLSSGFSDVRYFNRMFRERFGCSPKDYRRGKGHLAAEPQLLSDSTQVFYPPEQAMAVLESIRSRQND